MFFNSQKVEIQINSYNLVMTGEFAFGVVVHVVTFQ